MADVIETTIKAKQLADLVKEKPAVGHLEPKITKAKVEEVIELLKEVERHNGHFGVAEVAGVTAGQVKEIHAKMEARIAELQTVELTEKELEAPITGITK